jgi:lipid A 3-O-deacylase
MNADATMKKLLTSLILALTLPLAAAAAPRFTTVTVENDFFAGYDRHYTNGIQAAFVVKNDELPDAVRGLPPFRFNASEDVVVAVGQRIFTPSGTEVESTVSGERPYAGWLYGLADVRTRHDDDIVDHLTVTVGVVGPAALGRQVQNGFHPLVGKPEANGWNGQLRNEPAVTVGYERTWLGVARGSFDGRPFDLSTRVGATLGNVYTYANAGAVLRYGSHLPNDVPVTHISLGPPRDGYRGSAVAGWYVFGGVDARGVARNLFIDGNTFRDGPSADRKAFNHDLQFGVVAVWPEARVSFTLVRRSKEFEAQQGDDRFGQLAVSLAF